jgi:transitional endoplasmic reticulum ATPase
MLVQMENFDGVFISTTNLMDNLDKASIRRFNLKLKFDYLKPVQSWNIFLSYCKELKIRKPDIDFKVALKV